MNQYEVVIVGGGAAGLSAALVLARARRAVAVVDAGQPRNGPATHMHGYLSRDGFPPGELLALGRAEASQYGTKVMSGTVTGIVPGTTAGYEVLLDGCAPLSTRHVLVTTGLRDEIPHIPGFRERWGRDVLHCPYCHGYEVRDQALGILGGTPDTVEHALLVRQWSDDVIYFPHTDELGQADMSRLDGRNIAVVRGIVQRLIVTNDLLRGVELDGGRVIERSAIFIRPRLRPNADLLTWIGCTADDQQRIVTDEIGRTSVPGIWAAGNVINPRAQVITAAGEGSAVAIAINAALVQEDVILAAHERPGRF